MPPVERPKPKEQKPDPARRSVRPGDSLYYNGPGGIGHARVVCHGAHGVTLDIGGQHTPVRWQHVLGHRERMSYPARIVDHGEDGAVVEEDDGTQTFIEGLAPPEPEAPPPEPKTAWETALKKSLSVAPVPRALFFVKAIRPGLSLQAKVDKAGHQIHRWVKPGDVVKFQHPRGGDAHGEVVASGHVGATVRDGEGVEHQVKHGDYRPHDGAAEAPPAMGESKPQSRKFFDPAEVAKLPHKSKVLQTVFDSWESAAKIAPQAHAEYQGLLDGIGQQLGFSAGRGDPNAMSDKDLDSNESFIFMGPLKKQDKATAKVNNDYNGKWGNLKDLVRATIAVRSIQDVHAALDGLKKAGLELAQQPKDNMTHGTADGYRDLNLILRLPKTGMLVELQVAVKQIGKVKGEAHHYYNDNILLDQKRKKDIRAGGKSAGSMRVGEPPGGYDENNPDEERNWPDKGDFGKFMANRKRQQEIYGGAWKKVPGIETIAKALARMALGAKLMVCFEALGKKK